METKKLRLVALTIAAFMVSSVAYAFVYPLIYSTKVTTSEPFSMKLYDDLAITYPGQVDQVILEIDNLAPVTYGVKVTVSVSGPATWEYVQVSGTLTEAAGGFNIAPGSGFLWIKVKADPDAAALQDIQVSFQVERVGPI
jgi:hypothetical protein